MKTPKIGHGNRNNYSITTMILFGLLVVTIYFITYTPFSSFQTHHHQNKKQHFTNSPPIYIDDLDEALSKASKGSNSKRVIITIINKAYIDPVNGEYPSMFDLFLEGFWEGEGTRALLDNLLVVAMDRTAYERCIFRRLNCYRLLDYADDNGESGEKIFMSKGFIDMMWRRTLFLLDVLRRGYNFIFTDTDVIWLRNPYKQLSSNTTEDMQISTDIFTGDPWSKYNPINTGFYYVRSSPKTITLFETWYAKRKDYPAKMKEQDILAIMKRKGVFEEIGLVVRYLDVVYFNGFCVTNRFASKVVTVHANCCRGVGAKIVDLKNVIKDWKTYKNSNDDDKNDDDFQWTPHVNCQSSFEMFRNKTLG